MGAEAASTLLWLADKPLVLASGSQMRRDLLVNAGIPVDVVPAMIDERRLENDAPEDDSAAVARALATAKALDVSARHPGRLVLGADQTLALGGRPFHKPADAAAARSQLQALQGQRHQLVSAYAIARDGLVIAQGEKTAALSVRALSPAMLERYLAAAGPAVFTSVGAYQLEQLGAHLMDDVDGDHFTVLGLPVIEVLASLRRLGAVAA